MNRFSGYALLATAVIACPCHLALTLPLVLVLLGGTTLGTFLATRSELVFVAALVYFIIALVAGLALLNRWADRQLSGRPSRNWSIREKEGSLPGNRVPAPAYLSHWI